MSYKIYNVNMKDALSVRSGTDGFQPKFLVDNGTNFLKVQCVIGRTLRDDWRVEDIASRICSDLRIYSVQQTPCRVIVTEGKVQRERMGVVSKNFSLDGSDFVSFATLASKSNKFLTQNDAVHRLAWMIDVMESVTGFSRQFIMQYFFNMTIADLLVANQDRHERNFGAFFNNTRNCYYIAPLFDFGMGLFENDTVYDNITNLEDCMRYCCIEPYGEDPFELLDMFCEVKSFKNYFKSLDLRAITLNKRLFVHCCAYEYFMKMRDYMIRKQVK